MTQHTPTTTLDPRYSGPDASAVDWSDGQRELEAAQIYWLVTVRPDGRPHVAPLLSVWLDGALYHGEGHAAGEYATRVLVYEIVPETAFGFGRGAAFGQTRWRF
jgi:hypothetical protein